jgi:hypothetical protein
MYGGCGWDHDTRYRIYVAYLPRLVQKPCSINKRWVSVIKRDPEAVITVTWND